MQKELQFTLSIIGILIIGGVLLHGLWTIRKNTKKQKKSRLESRNWDPGFEQEDAISGEAPIYDDRGVGKARVVINTENDKIEAQSAPKETYDVHDDVINTPAQEPAPLAPEIPPDTPLDFSPIREASEHESTHELEQKPFHEEKHTLEDDVKQANDFAHLDTLPSIDDLTETDEPELLKPYQDETIKIEEPSVSNNAEDEILDSAGIEATKLNQESIELTETATEDIGSLAQEQKTEQGLTLEVEESKNESESAVYSNVVTQPKPEFSRPILTNPNLDNSFGQPPEFLLRKDKGEGAEDVESTNTQNIAPTEVQTPEAENITSGITVEEPNIPSAEFSLNIQEGPDIKVDVDEESKATDSEKDLSFTEQAKRFVRRNKKTVGEKIRKDPVLKDKTTEDQMRIDFDESQEAKAQEEASKARSTETNTSSSAKAEVGETDVLVLNIRSTDENPIQGASLLPMLLTLGFKFGEHDIFHRHVNTNGKGPILFSLTNMFKPGVFDIDNIENFSTYGLSLFMMLPIEGDAQQVFNMMHNAARKLSEEFGCRILDGNKVGVSKQSMQQYVERIREFERKRINK
jgi:cell division protein ZipA